MKKKVFILDDNEELLEIMQLLLERQYQVKCSDTAETVVREIMDFSPDLLILDHSIGDIKSLDILVDLKKLNAGFSVPVILFSAHPMLSEIATMIGANGYIDKPSDIDFIREYINGIMEKHYPAN